MAGRLARGDAARHRPPDREGDGFYQKRLPRGAPDFVETVEITFPSGRTAGELCPTEPASLVWAAQMGALTFHPWPVRRPEVDHPDELRLDLDPQPGTTFADARRVADVARELLEELGLRGYPKTSGNRGVHIYVRIQPTHTFEDVRHAAIGFGRELERRDGGVTTAWWKEERGQRIFLDFNQNNRDRTIASAWSLRAAAGCAGEHAADLGRARRGHRSGGAQPDHGPGLPGRGRSVGRHGRRGLPARLRCSSCGRRCPAVS